MTSKITWKDIRRCVRFAWGWMSHRPSATFLCKQYLTVQLTPLEYHVVVWAILDVPEHHGSVIEMLALFWNVYWSLFARIEGKYHENGVLFHQKTIFPVSLYFILEITVGLKSGITVFSRMYLSWSIYHLTVVLCHSEVQRTCTFLVQKPPRGLMRAHFFAALTRDKTQLPQTSSWRRLL